MTFEVVGKWDISRIQKIAPEMDAPIIILYYHGIPCSVHGSPLEKLDTPINGYMYREMYRRDGKPRVSHESKRSTVGRIIRINQDGNLKQHRIRNHNRYLVAVQDVAGNIDPIVEVTNGGRCSLRCNQWAQVLHLPFRDGVDQMELSTEEYKMHLLTLSQRLIL